MREVAFFDIFGYYVYRRFYEKFTKMYSIRTHNAYRSVGIDGLSELVNKFRFHRPHPHHIR